MIKTCSVAAIVGLSLATASAANEPAANELAAAATTIGQPAAVALPIEPARVRGFRSATFGATPDEVRAAVARDYGPEISAAFVPAVVEPGFSALATRATVEEVGGDASLLYVFSDDRLVAVNLVRATSDAPSAEERDSIAQAAGRLAGHLLSKAWRPFALVRGRPLPGGQVIVLAAADDVGDGVEVRLVGVGYEARWPDGRRYASPQPGGGAALRVVFRQDIDGLAILKQGDF